MLDECAASGQSHKWVVIKGDPDEGIPDVVGCEYCGISKEDDAEAKVTP